MWEADDSQDLWATPGNSPAASMAHGERMVGSELTAEDLDVDRTLRPQRLDDYCGQEHIKQSLRVLIEAAQSRGETLDHVIFSGPPGLGKTTLATVIANELGAQIKTTSGPAIARTGDLAAILTNLQPGDVLFIDEIHRLNTAVEEILYPAMEDYAIDIIIGKGPSANSIRLDLPKFTLIGATTRAGQLSAPLRDRFGVTLRLELYTPEELALIRERMAEAGVRNLGAYVRKMALNGYVLHVDLSPVRELVSLQRRCSNNLNQVAIQANTYGGIYPEEIAALQRDYAALWGPLSDLLERLSAVVEL